LCWVIIIIIAECGQCNLSRRFCSLLEDSQRVDGPIGIPECLRVVGDVVGAGAAQSRTCRVAAPNATGPVAAEGHIENDLVVREKLGYVTAACELREWLSPSVVRLRIGAQNVGRNGTALEEPDADRFVSPFHGVDTTSDIVEAITVGVVLISGDLTAQVVGLIRGVDVAVVRVEAAGEVVIVVDVTTVCRVQCHGVVVLCVHTLNDINLTTIGPAGSNHPVCRPWATGVTRHMVEVENDETAGVVGFLAGQADTGSTIGLDVGMIDSDVDLAIRVANQTGVPCWALVNVLDEAVSRVRFCKEVEHVEKCCRVVVILKNIASYAQVDEWNESKQKRNEWHVCERVHGCNCKRMIAHERKKTTTWTFASAYIAAEYSREEAASSVSYSDRLAPLGGL
jgi:hypothetical protein